MIGASSYERLCAKSDAHACDAQHRQIVRSVTDGDDLFQRDVFLLDDSLKQLGLFGSIDYLGRYISTDHAVNDIELVGKDVIDAHARLQMPGKESKAAREDGCFIA